MRAIITADWHLRSDRPRCRMDEDWISTQGQIMAQIAESAINRQCPVCIIGDIFHTPTVPPKILKMMIMFVAALDERGLQVYVIAGNHDLPYHSWQNASNSSFGTLMSLEYLGAIHHLSELGKAAHFGEEMRGPDNRIMFLHELVFQSSGDLPPNIKARTAQQLLDDYPSAGWIFTGDNHRGFEYEHNGRRVINPGCITRQAADFKDYVPRIIFVDTDKDVIEVIPLDDKAEMVADEYLTKEEDRKNRISAFVETIRKSSAEVGFDFRENVETAMKEVDLSPGARETIYRLLEIQ